ncbi:putative sodium- and chloride-dependent betaine transporter [Apostichopus japonicus]|uniref:Putative sodium-and chloride-dependent betaine transporter n=1 Tax=Stichopus japonicus TaxID=307972 RepID=A0A2G8L4M4_STIJA|nr:putative sodium- and chloride-dependent betaine transporter [Apostichopus japonicus]
MFRPVHLFYDCKTCGTGDPITGSNLTNICVLCNACLIVATHINTYVKGLAGCRYSNIFSYSLGIGTMVALGSYNKYKHNFVRDAVLFAAANSGTSIYAGIVIFSVLGFMAGNQGKDISEVADSGPGLAFVAYPEGLAQMPGAPIWSVMFFFMLILLGIDSEFVGVEGFVTAIVDVFPYTFRRGNRREIFAACVCASYCVFGLCMTTYGGMYIFQLFDYYSASGSTLLWITTFECIGIGWVYGAENLSSSFYEMSGWKLLNPYLYISWKFLTPLFTGAVFIFSLVKYEPLKYNDEYVYPTWGYVMGWMMAAASMVVPPTFMFYKFVIASRGSLAERWKMATTSTLRPRIQYTVPEEINSIEAPHSLDMDGSNGIQPPPSYPEVTGEATKF